MRTGRMTWLVLALGLLAAPLPAAVAAGPPAAPPSDLMPPRLSLVDGQVGFWRPGAQTWAQAALNTPLAAGDELATGSPGTVELQIGARAFVRGWASTQLGLEAVEPEFLQFRVAAGDASFDLRGLAPGQTVEVDTPNAAFTVEQSGYYRVHVAGDRTSFIARRGGRATLTPAVGATVAVTPSEEVVVEGTASPQVTAYAAPPLDEWDTWNYTRTEDLLDAVSARYVSPGAYGVDDLDRYGTWRIVPPYGPVWVPTGEPAGWAPYSTGSWILDPLYGWTWVDTAPWGWAPYHHGRWVFVDGLWAWAPGPVVARPVYAPALVAFFGGPLGPGPVVGWVALGWGEPVVPWWGRPGFVHVPSWRGWGGPRVVNNVVISQTTVVTATNVTVYRNASVHNAVIAVHETGFGRGPIASARVQQIDVRSLQLIRTAPRVAAGPASFVPSVAHGIRPPDEVLRRSVVATRPPHRRADQVGGERRAAPVVVPAPPRVVSLPPKRERESQRVLPRPPFGQSTIERPPAGRPQSPPPRERERARREEQDRTAPASAAPQPPGPPGRAQAPAPPQAPARIAAPAQTQPLPGQPANRLAPHREEHRAPERERREHPSDGRRQNAPEKGPRDQPGR